MNRTGLIILAGILLAIIFYELRWGYEPFEVEDVAKPVMFTHKRWIKIVGHNFVRLRIKADLPSGMGFINVYGCPNGKIQKPPVINYTIQGNVYTITSNYCYADQICITYKPRQVVGGKVTLWAALR